MKKGRRKKPSTSAELPPAKLPIARPPHPPHAGWQLYLAAIALAGCGAARAEGAPTAAGGEPIPVRTAPIVRRVAAQSVRAPGLVAARHETDLAFKVPGIVTAVFVEEGARVKRGQPLARIDATELSAGVALAREGVRKGERDLDRAKTLHESGTLPLVEVQNTETALAMSRAQLSAAAYNGRQATLVAPDTGVVDRRLVQTGQVVAAGVPLFHLSSRSAGWVVRVAVPDEDALSLRPLAAATITIDALPSSVIEGKLIELSETASARTGLFEAEILLSAPPPSLRAGLSAKVEIAAGSRPAVEIPLGALATGQGRDASVFVIEGGKARRLSVQVERLVGDHAEISRGLDGVNDVVVDGAARLTEGAPVVAAP